MALYRRHGWRPGALLVINVPQVSLCGNPYNAVVFLNMYYSSTDIFFRRPNLRLVVVSMFNQSSCIPLCAGSQVKSEIISSKSQVLSFSSGFKIQPKSLSSFTTQWMISAEKKVLWREGGVKGEVFFPKKTTTKVMEELVSAYFYYKKMTLCLYRIDFILKKLLITCSVISSKLLQFF